MLRAIVLTLFPEMFPGPLGHSLAGRALAEGLWSLEAVNIRDYAQDKHGTVDDRPYGGGTGMVLRPDVVGRAIDAALEKLPGAALIYPSPRGAPFHQRHASALMDRDMVILCGRFEGVDQRILDYYQPIELAFGDAVLSGGELPAMTLLDACVRLIPGVISKESALDEESFSPRKERGPAGQPALGGAPCDFQEKNAGTSQDSAGLLEYPHYTRPPAWKALGVPEPLLSGNHAQIKAWRQHEAEAATKARRPEMWDAYQKKNT